MIRIGLIGEFRRVMASGRMSFDEGAAQLRAERVLLRLRGRVAPIDKFRRLRLWSLRRFGGEHLVVTMLPATLILVLHQPGEFAERIVHRLFRGVQARRRRSKSLMSIAAPLSVDLRMGYLAVL